MNNIASIIFLFSILTPFVFAKDSIKILTGLSSGTYIKIGSDIKKISTDLNIEVLPSDGSLETICRINQKPDHVGIIQMDVLNYLSNSDFTINCHYRDDIHILTNKSIKTLKDLKGKKILVDRSQSSIFQDIVSVDNIHVDEISEEINESSLDKLLNSKVDGIFIVGRKPIPLLNKLERLLGYRTLGKKLSNVHFLELYGNDGMPEKYQENVSISPNDYPWLKDNRTINTLGHREQNVLDSMKASENTSRILDLYTEEVHLLVNRDANITNIKHLINKEVIIGSENSGTWVTANNLLFRIFKLPEKEVHIIEKNIGHRDVDDLIKGNIDAIFYVGGQPISLFKKLADVERVKEMDISTILQFVSITRDEIADNDSAYKYLAQYKEAEIMYEWMDDPVEAISVTSSFVSFTETDKRKRACRVAKNIIDNLSTLTDSTRAFHEKWSVVGESYKINKFDIDNFIQTECVCTDSFIIKEAGKVIKRIEDNFADCDKKALLCGIPLLVARDYLKDAKKFKNIDEGISFPLESLKAASIAEQTIDKYRNYPCLK